MQVLRASNPAVEGWMLVWSHDNSNHVQSPRRSDWRLILIGDRAPCVYSKGVGFFFISSPWPPGRTLYLVLL